jgi:hypothetical protein
MRARPTRIVAPPMRRSGKGCGRGPQPLRYPCNDGNSYLLAELAALIGITPSGLSIRIRTMGWAHAKVLSLPQRGKRNYLNTDPRRSCKSDDSGDLAYLSDADRSYNLAKIPIGTFERQENL